MKCHICNQEIITRPKFISDQPTCSDCYFDELGAVIEKYPIGFKFYKHEEEK